MNKEQTQSNTPITARDIIDTNLNSISGLAFESVKHYAESGMVSGSLLLAIEKSMEQYAQAKVLEALEREFLLANEEAEFYQLDEYYKTEVKPKYKK